MDAYREEYENYEPELKVWPYILLGFLVPMVPFICNILLYKEGIVASYNFLWNLFNYILIATAYFVTANVVRTSKGSWILALVGGLYFILILCFWGFYKLKGVSIYPLGVPFVVAVIPAFLFILSYSFYAKRSRLPAWGTSTLLCFFIGVLFILYFYFSSHLGSVGDIVYLVYSSLFVLLSLFTLFVTKRSEASPWYINIVLVAFVFTSLFTAPGFDSSFSVDECVVFILKTVATSYSFWIMVSLCFIYAGLGMKSCFKNLDIRRDDGIDELIVKQSIPGYAPKPTYPEEREYQNNSSYAYPSPDIDRFSKREGARYKDDSFEGYEECERGEYSRNVDRSHDRRDNYSDSRKSYSDNRDRYPDDRGNYSEYNNDRKYYDDEYYSRRRASSDRYDYEDSRDRQRQEVRRRASFYDEDDFYDDYDRRPSREREERPPLLERDDRRSYNNDSYRNSKPSSGDKWYDLLRGGIDKDEYERRDERNHRDSRW